MDKITEQCPVPSMSSQIEKGGVRMKYLTGIGVTIVCSLVLAACNSLKPTTPTMIPVTPTTTVLLQTPNGFMSHNSASTESIDGLNLILSLESTTYKSGQDVYVTIDEHNILTTDINVPVANRTAYEPLSLGDVCGSDYSFFGIAVFRGVCTSANISKGTLLPFWNYSATPPCPTPTITPPGDFHFWPLDNSFRTLDLSGYWKGSPSATLTKYEPGVYTVVAGDEWGALVFVQFMVTN
jgi:hypothetical protein